ncbi:MoaF-related domain-containing protein [Myroides odoratus]|uniref:MoaF-related domain-containing protein n=1 Tax=Myroides odoratus TaxID=256 RepID=UPI0039AF9C40
MKKISLLLLLASIGLSSCTQTKKQVNEQINSEINEKDNSAIGRSNFKEENLELIEKKAVLTYPDFTAYMTYTSATSLHWKTVQKNGQIAEGDEVISYKKISNGIFFLNWIEKDGFTVSQIVDVQKGKVSAFLSFEDDKSEQGKRSSIFTEATFRFDE